MWPSRGIRSSPTGCSARLAPGQPAELGDGGRGSDAQLLHGLERDQRIHAAESAERRQRAAGRLRRQSAGRDAGVRADAIDGEVVRIGALSGGRELSGFAAGRRE